MKALYTDLAQYNYWANERLCQFLDQLTDEQRDRELTSSFTTIRKTVYHIWDAETIWYTRLNGESLDHFPSKNYRGTYEEFRTAFLQRSTDLVQLVEASGEEFFKADCIYHNTKGDPFSQKNHEIFSHLFNHSTFHRGQLVTMLRQVGFTDLKSTDLIWYFRTQH